MNKNLLLTLTAFGLLFGKAHAQLTITQSNHPTLQSDTGLAEVQKYAQRAGVLVPARGANKVWDYSGLKDSSNLASLRNFATATNPTFTAKGATRLYGYENLIAGAALPGVQYEKNDANAHATVGYRLPYKVRVAIGSATGNSSDTLYFPMETRVYKNPRPIIKYPATFNSNWSWIDTERDSFFLSIQNLGMDSTPGYRQRHAFQRDTVVGWGALTVPVYPAKGSSIKYDVLMVKSYYRAMDSFYVGGNPAPAMLLTAFGLNQGSGFVSTYYSFYRAGHSNPIMQIFTDTLGKRATSVTYDPQNTALAGIEELTYDAISAKAYPNPVINNKLTVSFEKATAGSWKVSIYSTTGQEVYKQNVQGQGNVNASLELPAVLSGGMYFYSVQDEKGAVKAGGSLQLER